MNLHVVSLPHTQTTHEFDHCAYTAKVRKFCGMMRDQGHHVVLYAGDENEADCDELVTCITRAEQDALLPQEPWFSAGIQAVDWDASRPYWRLFNGRVIEGLRERKAERDIVCLITGCSQQEIIDAFPYPQHIVVEFGVGYGGIAAPFQVYESYAWMHAVYGQRFGATQADGRFFDAVIPNYFTVDEFPFQEERSDPYYVFMSRMTPRKGYEIAIETTARIGARLLIAGDGGDRPQADHVEYVGHVNAAQRGELLSGALGTFMSTLYLEPFGGVAVESLLSGTPVISTDFGAFPELIAQGEDGFRCRIMAEFEEAALAVAAFSDESRAAMRRRAQGRFGTGPVGLQYKRYFDQLATLWGDGFHTSRRPSGGEALSTAIMES